MRVPATRKVVLHITVTIPVTSMNRHKIYRNLPGAEVGVNSVGIILVTLSLVGAVPLYPISVQPAVFTIQLITTYLHKTNNTTRKTAKCMDKRKADKLETKL